MARIGDNVYFRQTLGKWEGRYIRGRKADGRLWYGYVSAKSEEECIVKRDRAAQAFVEEKRLADIGDRLVFASVASQWLDSVARTRKDSTICKYRNNIRLHLNKRFGDRRYTEIKKEEAADYAAELLSSGNVDGTGMLPNTVKGIISVLRAVVEYGESQYHAPAANLTGIQIGGKDYRPPRVLTKNEEEMLLDYILTDLDSDGLAILLVLYTGLRIGELCALRWDDIDLKEEVLTVRCTMKRIQTPDNPDRRTKVVITPPKTQKSERKIPLHFDVCAVMKERRGNEGTFFLTGLKNSYIEPKTMQNRFKKVLKAVGIKDATFHTLRHTFATRSIEHGIDAKVLSEILGHSSVKITLDRYVHPSEEQKRRCVDMLPGFRDRIGNG